MTNEIKALSNSFDLHSKVWIYTSDRVFTNAESTAISNQLALFAAQWTSHGAKVKGEAILLHNRFIIFIADENACGVGGCSLDKTVAIIREIAQQYQVDLFNRFLISYREEEQIITRGLGQFKELLASKQISEQVIVFNTMVNHLQALLHWEQAYEHSPYASIEAPISFLL
ncbi:MAG: ABC transporter ATPase [Bacteroidota bacterium]